MAWPIYQVCKFGQKPLTHPPAPLSLINRGGDRAVAKKGKFMSNNKFIEKILTTIKKHEMITAGDRIVVGVSGGPDSICLLNVLNELKDRLSIKLYVVHINHCIRGETADQDEQFVKDFACRLGLSVYSEKLMIIQMAKSKKISIEEAGRIARYNCFEEYLKELDANKIAVGHNMNDSVETFLFNLVRGTGIEGLKGIEPVRGNIIRPLIETGRDEIEVYCKEEGLVPRIDETNADFAFTRNRIRNGLIPYVKQNFNPNIIETLNRTADIINDENQVTSVLSESYYNECLINSDKSLIEMDLKKFNMLHDAVKKRIIRLAVEKLKGNTKAVEKIHIEQAIDLAQKAKTGTVYRFNKGIEVRIKYGNLVIMKEKFGDKKDFCYDINIPSKIEIPELKAYLTIMLAKYNEIDRNKKDNNICLLDKEKLAASLQVRNRRNGDRINPEGMKGTKKLKDYFIDEKIPREERDLIPMITEGQEIIWIVGKRYSEKYKITDDTKEVVIIEYLLNR